MAAGAAGNSADELRRVLEHVGDRAQRFFGLLAQNSPAHIRSGAETRVRITSGSLEPVYEEGALLMGELDTLEATAALIKPPADADRKLGDPGPQDPQSLGRLT